MLRMPRPKPPVAALVPTVEQAFGTATHDDLRPLLEVLRVEIHVLDRTWCG